jgi:hypothetical protein
MSPLVVVGADGQRWPSMMIAVVNYAIFSNVCFTTGYFLPETLPLWFLPRQLLVNFLWAIAIATAVHFIVLQHSIWLISGIVRRVLDICVGTFARL